MTYRHHSLRCHHRVQNTQGSNEHQLRITCQECQGHLAIIYGKHLTAESRRLVQQHLDETLRYSHPAEPPPEVRRQWTRWDHEAQPRARAAAAMPQAKAAPEPPVQQDDIEVTRARMALKIAQLDQEIRRRSAAQEAMPRRVQPPQQLQGQGLAPPPEEWDFPEDMPEAQESPRQHRPTP